MRDIDKEMVGKEIVSDIFKCILSGAGSELDYGSARR